MNSCSQYFIFSHVEINLKNSFLSIKYAKHLVKKRVWNCTFQANLSMNMNGKFIKTFHRFHLKQYSDESNERKNTYTRGFAVRFEVHTQRRSMYNWFHMHAYAYFVLWLFWMRIHIPCVNRTASIANRYQRLGCEKPLCGIHFIWKFAHFNIFIELRWNNYFFINNLVKMRKLLKDEKLTTK